MTRQEEIIFRIIREILSGERKKGETIRRNEYELNKNQMSDIFKILSKRNIIEKADNSVYIITDMAVKNSKELCLSEISERLNDIFRIAESGNISKELLIDFIKMLMKEKRTNI